MCICNQIFHPYPQLCSSSMQSPLFHIRLLLSFVSLKPCQLSGTPLHYFIRISPQISYLFPIAVLLHLSPTMCFCIPFLSLPSSYHFPFLFLSCQSNPSSSVQNGHLCHLWWFRQAACILSELPKAEACSPLIVLFQVPGMDQLTQLNWRRSAQNLCYKGAMDNG